MAQTDNDRLQINVDFTKTPEVFKALEEMVAEDPETDRSKFIRNLIRQEYARRQQLPLFPEKPTQKKSGTKQATAIAA